MFDLTWWDQNGSSFCNQHLFHPRARGPAGQRTLQALRLRPRAKSTKRRPRRSCPQGEVSIQHPAPGSQVPSSFWGTKKQPDACFKNKLCKRKQQNSMRSLPSCLKYLKQGETSNCREGAERGGSFQHLGGETKGLESALESSRTAFGIAVTVGMFFHQEGKSDWAPHTITEPPMGTPPGKRLKSRRRRRRRLVYFTMIMKRAFALWPNEKRFFKKKNNTYRLVV